MKKAKSKLPLIILVITAICVCFALIGCNNDNTLDDVTNVARDKFGCTKILWLNLASYDNNVGGCDVPMEGGYYAIGLDKDGNEVYIVVPKCKSDKIKAATFAWPFDYTFSQIAKVYSQYGYKYSDGIEGHEEDYCYSHSGIDIRMLDTEYRVKTQLKSFGDADELYEKLDIKLMFEFSFKSRELGIGYYYLVQEDGLFKMYEVLNKDYRNFTVTTFDKDGNTLE
ncbi:MAG: hypothetical protein J1F71_01515 [Clostridiales bacterium]|nr:hypothetical protein [Clostridiales bacterium]